MVKALTIKEEELTIKELKFYSSLFTLHSYPFTLHSLLFTLCAKRTLPCRDCKSRTPRSFNLPLF